MKSNYRNTSGKIVFLGGLLLAVIIAFTSAADAGAGKWFTNPDTGESVYVPDYANAFATAVTNSNIFVQKIDNNGTPDDPSDDFEVFGSTYDYETPIDGYRNPADALGEANYTSHAPGQAYNTGEFVSLGNGGSLTLQFGNKNLVGHGSSAYDLWIFEIGDEVEATDVEISADGITWFSVGRVEGSTRGIDIDAYAYLFGGITDFSYVRLTDVLGLYPDGGAYGGWAGADIDAVAIIPEPSTMVMLVCGSVLGIVRRYRPRS